MFRLRLASACVRRTLFAGPGNRDPVLDQLQGCPSEDQVFEVVGKNKAKLDVNHVCCAMGMLWQFQKDKPQFLRTPGVVTSHPQFLTIRVLAENKISLMDDSLLVDMLYNVLRLNMEHHDSLVQQLVLEASVRLESLPLSSLSKFAICLIDQHLQMSPLMGRITDIVARKVSTIDDARILTTLMISVSATGSLRLRDLLIDRADHLLDTMDPTKYNNPRRVVQFLRNIKFIHRGLLEKCNRLLMQSIPLMDLENLTIIMGLYQSLQFYSCDFRLATKQRLLELIDSSTDPESFTKLFVVLCPMASTEIREWLENTALLLADELKPQQVLAIAVGLEETQSRNMKLINKIASIIQKNLYVYKGLEVAKITQALFLLHYQNPELFSKLRSILISYVQVSLYTFEVTMITRVLTMLPGPRLEPGAVSRLDGLLPQCSLRDVITLAQSVGRCLDAAAAVYRQSSPGRYVQLLQAARAHGRQRLETAGRLDPLLEELRYASGEWFEETLLEHAVATLQRMADQITWSNVPDLAHLLTKTNHLCAPLMERIAGVALKDVDKLHPSAIYTTLLPFAILNYDSPTADELFDVCIQHLKPHISSFDPHMLVLLAYSLVVADCFPEPVFREIFNVDFLAKLDAHLETMPYALSSRVRLRLMEVNRAACLDCPEFQVPWFHARYCQQLERKGSFSRCLIKKQIHKILAEVLGGMDRARVSVLTPYFYPVDFECVLDDQQRSVPYSEPNTLLMSEGKAQWGAEPAEAVMSELPPGAQRVAVDFLDSKSFCKNSQHMKGDVVMKKRHLEIMGYRVVQIPHFEWNSMELSTEDAWKGYLKEKIFTELPSS